jgi:NADPH:quinone reductase
MKVVALAGFGGPEVLRIEMRPIPEPGSREVLIRVHAAGLNHADLLQREGRYPSGVGAPDWPGLEVAGVVEAIGPDATSWRVGDAVCALLPGGGYAEFAVASELLTLPLSSGTSAINAAGLVEATCTVWSNLREAGARSGETLLVHGGSGGIGTIAIQVAKSHGMRVLTTARGPERTARCRGLGADIAIDYTSEDFVEVARDAGGADVILDVLGGVYLERNLDALAVGGRLVIIGLQGGSHAELNLGALMGKRSRIISTTVRDRPVEQKAAIIADIRENIWPRIPGEISSVIHATFPLERAGDAHRLLESGEVFGKVVLTVDAT